MMNETIIKEVEKIVEDTTYGNGTVTGEYILFHSGMNDIETYIDIEGCNTIEEVKEVVTNYYEGYDVNEEALLWLQGGNAPDIHEIVDTLDEVEETLEKIAMAL